MAPWRSRFFGSASGSVELLEGAMHFRHLPPVTAFILMLGSTFDFALADVFSVDEPEVVKGEQEIEVNGAVQNGFPVNADPVRYSMEVEYTYGVTKWLSLSPLVDFDKPDGDSFHAIVAGLESVWFPVEVGQLLTVAWFTESRRCSCITTGRIPPPSAPSFNSVTTRPH